MPKNSLLTRGLFVNKMGQPTIEEVTILYKKGRKISLAVCYTSWGGITEIRTFQDTTITKIQPIGENNAFLWITDYQYGISLQDITSYSFYENPKIILTNEEAAAAVAPAASKQVFKLITDDHHQVLVDGQTLSASCDYFERLVRDNSNNTSSSEINLSSVFTHNQLWLLLKELEDPNENAAHLLNDMFDLLIAADVIKSHEILDKAYEMLTRRLNYAETKTLLLKARGNELHPLISHWIINFNAWLNYYGSSLDFYLLVEGAKGCLYSSFENLKETRQSYGEQLELLTRIRWSYNGAHFVAAQHCSYFNPHDSKDPDLYTQAVVRLLVSRQVLSRLESIYAMSVDVLDQDALFKLNPTELCNEINEVDRLLTQITGYPCDYLELREVDKGSDLKILQEIGCIKGKFYGYDVTIMDYDLPKLRDLAARPEIQEHYRSADKDQSRSDQTCVCPPERTGASSRVSTSTKAHLAHINDLKKKQSRADRLSRWTLVSSTLSNIFRLFPPSTGSSDLTDQAFEEERKRKRT